MKEIFINIYEKLFIISCLLSAIYVTFTCPCKIILSCHQREFFALIIVPLLYVIYKQP